MVSGGPRAFWSSRRRALAALALSLYAVLLAVSPVLHHDLACHMKSPTHCDACAANPLASRVETAVLTVLPGLPLSGEVAAPPARLDHGTPFTTAAGRAPPV
jgi:hypothetical protein